MTPDLLRRASAVVDRTAGACVLAGDRISPRESAVVRRQCSWRLEG